MSELRVIGKVVKKLEVVKGISKAGKEWQKAGFVLEIPGEWPKNVAFDLFGEKVKILYLIKENQEVEVFFNLESREWNEKYFTNVQAWKVNVLDNEPQQLNSPQPTNEMPF